MIDDADDPDAVRDRVLHRLATAGIETAVETAIDLCRDRKNPAAARATALGHLLRAAELGGFGKSSERAGTRKDPAEMDGLELAAAAAEVRRNLARLKAERARAADDDGGGAFA